MYDAVFGLINKRQWLGVLLCATVNVIHGIIGDDSDTFYIGDSLRLGKACYFFPVSMYHVRGFLDVNQCLMPFLYLKSY